jgi:hypothetical protein
MIMAGHMMAAHNAQQNSDGSRGDSTPIMKPERPNSLGPKLSKRINFYTSDNCECLRFFGWM